MSKSKTRFTITIDTEVYDDLKQHADSCYRSVSAEGALIITRHFKELEAKFPTKKVSVATDSAANRSTRRAS